MLLRSILIGSTVILAAGALPAVQASAQDFNGRPNFGTLNLRAGFTPDPQTVAVRSGGSLNAESLSSNCRGFISNAPDVRLNYSAGSYPLILSVNSGADTTIVVNAPDGSWYCDDDGGTRGMNPALRFNNPQSGRYEIWVGTYGNSSTQPATLHVSEVSSQ